MIKKISHCFANKLANNIEEQEILQYGFECLINTSIPIIFFFIFAVLENMIFETIIWLVLFLLLRNYIGGYHATTHERCILISTIYGLSILLFLHYIKFVPITVEVCICAIIIFFHILYGPIINDCYLLNNYTKYKKISLFLIVTETIAIIFLNYYNFRIHLCIFLSIISAEFLHYVERLKLIYNQSKNT